MCEITAREVSDITLYPLSFLFGRKGLDSCLHRWQILQRFPQGSLFPTKSASQCLALFRKALWFYRSVVKSEPPESRALEKLVRAQSFQKCLRLNNSVWKLTNWVHHGKRYVRNEYKSVIVQPCLEFDLIKFKSFSSLSTESRFARRDLSESVHRSLSVWVKVSPLEQSVRTLSASLSRFFRIKRSRLGW